MATGDLRAGDVVWLVPRTLGASQICWRRPRATVQEVAAAYLVVDVEGARHEVHRDNIRRSNPAHDRARPRKTKMTQRPEPAGVCEEPLW